MKIIKAIAMKNGKPTIQGVCPVCGTQMFRIGKSEGRVSPLVEVTSLSETHVAKRAVLVYHLGKIKREC